MPVEVLLAAIWLFSILDKGPRAAQDRAGFLAAQQVQSATGIGAS